MKKPTDSFNSRFELKELVLKIGYRLTAYLGRTTVTTVVDCLKNGFPNDLEERMEAAYAVAKPIERVESELVAQGFLSGGLDAFLNPNLSMTAPITTLRDATYVRAIRAELMARVKKEFLENVASDLEDVERQLKEWISKVTMPPHTFYQIGLSNDRERLWLKLRHIGFPLEQQLRFDRGEDWPLWDDDFCLYDLSGRHKLFSQRKENELKVSVSFANPFPIAIYTVSLLLIGFVIGSSYGHTLAAGWMLLIATILLLAHDVVIAVLLATAAARVASSGRNRERKLMHTEAESPECRRSKPHVLSQNRRTFSVAGKTRQHLSPREYLKLYIEEMEFSVRTHNFLKNSDIQTVRALIQLSEEELLHVGFTPEMITEIKGTLASIGLALRRQVAEK